MIDLTRMRDAMARQGLSQATLAARVGVSPAAIQQILNGRTKRPKYEHEIAAALGVDRDWLRGTSDFSARVHFVTDDEFDQKKELFWVKSSAKPAEAREVDASLVTISSNLLNHMYHSTGERAYLITIGTVSMRPTLINGDLALVKSCDSFDGSLNDIWLLYFNNHPLIRRVRQLQTGEFVLSSDEPGIEPVEVENSLVDVKGKIVWYGRQLAP